MNLREAAQLIAMVCMKRSIMVEQNHEFTPSTPTRIQTSIRENFLNRNNIESLDDPRMKNLIEIVKDEYRAESARLTDLINAGATPDDLYDTWTENKKHLNDIYLRENIAEFDFNRLEENSEPEKSKEKEQEKNTPVSFDALESKNPETGQAAKDESKPEGANTQNTPEPSNPAPVSFTQENTVEPPAAENKEIVKRPNTKLIDKNLISTLDRTLKSASKGEYNSFSDLFKQFEDYLEYVESLSADAASKKVEYERLLKNTATGQANPTQLPLINYKSAQLTSERERPVEKTWTTRKQKAHEVFMNYVPIDRAHEFNFDVTVYDWATPHPALLNEDDVAENYTFEVDALRDMLWGLETGQNTAIVGPPGCGKTVGSEIIAYALRRPYYRIPCDGELTRREVIGGMKAINGESVWYDGLLTRAIRYPSLIVLDEVDRIDPDLQYTMHQVLERKGVTILEDDGRVIMVNKESGFLSTANTMGKNTGDDNYQMRTELSEAIRDRINIWIKVGYLKENNEKTQIMSDYPFINMETATQIVKIANLMRSAYINGEISTVCSYRQIRTLCERIRWEQSIDSQKKQKEIAKMVCFKILQGRAASQEDEASIKQMIEST